MVRLCIITREKKRIKLFKKYFNKIKYLKNIIKNDYYKYNQKQIAYIKLQKIPRNSHFTRIKNRCHLTGRSRSYFRRFGLSRHIIRKLSLKGDIPGVTKSSW